MSAQTGRPGVAPPPPSSRRIDRARIGVARLRNDPNPVWMRELRQAARLSRTPIILAVITGVMALLICSVGGVASVGTEPAKVGVALFHTFFSLAFAVVTWVAPAVAASTIASERSGRTWEALLLTGLGAPTIARGKFLASLTYITLYIVMLVPVGALPFLFGGVTATEVVTAFGLLLLMAILSVAFGLSISSKFSSAAVAIVVTLLVAIPVSLLVYLLGGVALSFAVHDLWPAVPQGPPVWLPTAYARADFGLEYVAFLVLSPLLLVLVPGWFLYEVTIANMAGISDDRSTGVRRWFLASTPALALVTLVPALAASSDEWVAVCIALGTLFVFGIFAAFVFAGEPLGPSRRVQVHWDREGAGRMKRFLGPGILKASLLAALLCVGALALQMGVGAAIVLSRGGPGAVDDATRIVAFGAYGAAFLLFVIGFVAWTRARSTSSTVPRVLLVGVLFLAAFGPWLAMAVAGILTDGSDEARLVASPSPTYVFVVLDAVSSTTGERELSLMAAAICSAGWGFLGAGLFAAAGARVRRVLADHAAALARVEAMLEADDATATDDPPTEGDAPVTAESPSG